MSAIGGKMASLKKYRGRWSVKIRRKGHRGIYETFDKISDARSFINKVESDIVQQKYLGALTEGSRLDLLPKLTSIIT